MPRPETSMPVLSGSSSIFMVDVVLALEEQALLKLTAADDVALAADERGGRGLEHDGQGGRVDLDGLELDGVLGVGVDVADVGGVDAHDRGDVAGNGLGALLAAQVVEGKELLDLAHGSANRRS